MDFEEARDGLYDVYLLARDDEYACAETGLGILKRIKLRLPPICSLPLARI